MSDKVVGLEPVVATDHPDIVGGIVWSECELRWINSKLAALQAELAEANDSLTVAYMAGAASKLDEIRGLQAELAECKRDAERYRWLRDSTEEQLKSLVPFDDLKQSVYEGLPAREQLDAAIDAAREGK